MSKHTPATRPQVEHLEDRLTPSDVLLRKYEISGITAQDLKLDAELLVAKTPTIWASMKGVAVGYGSGSGPWKVRLYANTTTFQEFTAYNNLITKTGKVLHVATGDVNGDGVADVVTGLGLLRSFLPVPITSSNYPVVSAEMVRVFDGTTLGNSIPTVLDEFHPYGNAFLGGIHVAVADLDGDGKAEVLTSKDEGGVGRVRVFAGADLATGTATQVADFDGIDGDPNATAGAHIATGDLNNDNVPDLLVGAQNGPRVAVFDGTTLQAGDTPTKFYGDFFAFDPATHRGGLHVAVADFDADGYGEVLAGSRTGAPLLRNFDGEALITSNGATQTLWWDRTFGDTTSTQGIRIVGKSLDTDSRDDLVISHGSGSRLTTIRGAFVVPGGPDVLWPGQMDVLTNWNHGVWVG